MKNQNTSLLDRLWLRLCALLAEYKVPFIASLLTGLVSHGYAFSNKLVNHDEVESLFGKGATITSGRWGLELVKLLFPDWSMPWIYGLVSVLLISLAACLVVKILGIRSKPMQGMLGMLLLSFPSLTGNFCFMFTSSAYALSFFLAVLAVYEFVRGGRVHIALGVICLVLALSMYQAYISVAASIFVVLMIARALDGVSIKSNVIFGLKALFMMALSIALYYSLCLLVFKFTGAEFNSYVTDNVTGDVGIIRKIRMAYDNFFYIFSFRNFYIISDEASRYIHIALGLVAIIGLASAKKLPNVCMAAFLTALLPLSICCMFLIMSTESIHTLVLYSFTAVYMLLFVVLERMEFKFSAIVRDASALLLAAVILSNVYFANMVYLKLELQYENAYSFYTSLMAQVKDTEGFDEDSRLAIIGRQDNLLHTFPELDTELMLGPARDLVNIYSRENFIKYYLGFDIPFATEQELDELSADARVEAMAEYPYYGSVLKIDDYIVVKLG